MKHSRSRAQIELFLSQLGSPIEPAPLLSQLEVFVDALLQHAERRDLLSASQRNENAVWSHVLDSLQPLGLESVSQADSLVDAGSGGGLPGVPLAIALPAARVHLVERSSAKSEFLELVKALVPLHNVEIRSAELHECLAVLPSEAIVVARALMQPPQWAQLLAKRRTAASWLLFATEHNHDEWIASASSVALKHVATRAYELPESPGKRVLLQFSPQ